MSKQNEANRKPTATALVATLNKQFKAIDVNQHKIKLAADQDDDKKFLALVEYGKTLDTKFDKTLAQLKEMGETVKFDSSTGEYFLGDKKFRIEYRVVSVGVAEIEAPTEQIAMIKAREMADYDRIDLVEVSGTLTNRSMTV